MRSRLRLTRSKMQSARSRPRLAPIPIAAMGCLLVVLLCATGLSASANEGVVSSTSGGGVSAGDVLVSGVSGSGASARGALASGVSVSTAWDSIRSDENLLERIVNAISGSTVQWTSDHRSNGHVLSQQLDLRLAPPGWRVTLDANVSTVRESRVRLTATRDLTNGQVDIGYLSEATPFGLVIPRSGVNGARVRLKVTSATRRYSSSLPWFLPRVQSPYARMHWVVGDVKGQLFTGAWFYEPRCSIGVFAPVAHDEVLVCSLHQLPGSYGSLQLATKIGGAKSGPAGAAAAETAAIGSNAAGAGVAARFAYQLKAKIDTALGTTSVESAQVPLDFSSFVADLGEQYHGWSINKVTHSRRYPFDLTISWSEERRDPLSYLDKPQEVVTARSVSVGTADLEKFDASIGLTSRDYVNTKDGRGTELQAVATSSIDYLWDYDPCRATISVQYKNGGSVSLPDYPGYRGWFEKGQLQLVANGSFSISSYLGRFTFSLRHSDSLTTRLDETNLRFTSYSTLTDQLTARWDCIPIEPWTAVNMSMSLKNYSHVVQSCPGGPPGTPGSGDLSYSREAYKSLAGTVSSTVALPSVGYARTLALTGTVELRQSDDSDSIKPTFTGKAVYTLKF